MKKSMKRRLNATFESDEDGKVITIRIEKPEGNITVAELKETLTAVFHALVEEASALDAPSGGMH